MSGQATGPLFRALGLGRGPAPQEQPAALPAATGSARRAHWGLENDAGRFLRAALPGSDSRGDGGKKYPSHHGWCTSLKEQGWFSILPLYNRIVFCNNHS